MRRDACGGTKLARPGTKGVCGMSTHVFFEDEVTLASSDFILVYER